MSWIDVSRLTQEQRRYVEIEYREAEEVEQGFRLVLADGRKAAIYHQEIYHHDPGRKVVGVPIYVAERRGCR